MILLSKSYGQYYSKADSCQNMFSSETFWSGEVHSIIEIRASSFPIQVKRHKMGIYGLLRHYNPIIKKDWINNGYNIDNSHIVELYMGTIIPIDNVVIMFGGGISEKSFMGIHSGISLKRDRFEVDASGCYSLYCKHNHLSMEEKESPHRITTNGFDPNSWYKLSFLWMTGKVSSIGLISERFYGTRALYQYKPQVTGLHWNQMTLNSSIGWDFEFKHFITSIGMSIKIFWFEFRFYIWASAYPRFFVDWELLIYLTFCTFVKKSKSDWLFLSLVHKFVALGWKGCKNLYE